MATASSSQLSGESARPTGGFLFWSSIFAVGLFAAAPASAAIITFDEAPPSLVHGSIVTTQYVGINGVTISAINPNRSHNLAVAFNTLVDPDDTTDDDLVGPPTEDWDFGNLSDPVQVELKNILIVQENNTGIVGGVVGDPDDEGSRPHAGDLIFEFATAITQFGFSIVDVEGAIEPGTFLTFFMGGAELAEVPFTEFTNAASVFFDATVVFGDNSANKLPTITGALLDAFNASLPVPIISNITQMDKVIVRMGGSGGIDNLRFEEVPEPADFLLLGVGLGVLVVARRRFAAKS